MQIAKYIAVVLLGSMVGWYSQNWLSGYQVAVDLQRTTDVMLDSESSQPSAAREVAENLTNPIAEATPSILQSSQAAEINPNTLIESLSLMDRRAFSQYLNSLDSDSVDISKELLIGVLNILPTITDSKTWYRVVDFLSSSRNVGMQKREFVTEDWVMDKIRKTEQQTQWLEVVSHLGVWRRDNIEFLANNLESFHDSESRVSALLALSKSIDLDQTQSVGFDRVPNGDSIVSKIEQFFNSELELERAAAVSTLRSFPNGDFSNYITDALDDPSESVRLSAIFTLTGGRRPNETAIKDRLIKRMQSSEASDFERVNAWVALGTFQLEGEYYKAVYDFGLNDQERLTQRYKSEGLRPRSQWGY